MSSKEILGVGRAAWSLGMGVAEAVVVERPPPKPLQQDEIALPVEGEGRRLSIPVVFEHGERTVEVWMLLDTGATYTTLPMEVLDQLGLRVPARQRRLQIGLAGRGGSHDKHRKRIVGRNSTLDD